MHFGHGQVPANRFVRPDGAIVDVATEVSERHGRPAGVKPGADGRIRLHAPLAVVLDGHFLQASQC